MAMVCHPAAFLESAASESHALASSSYYVELKEESAQAQGLHSEVHETIAGMPESQPAAMQQQHTADMLQAVAEYVRQGLKPGSGHAEDPVDSLAAMQRSQIIKLINEVTHYLRRDMQHLQQMCDMIAAKPLPYRSAKDHKTSSLCASTR